MEVDSALKSYKMIQARRLDKDKLVSPRGREGSPSPYDFCNNRSDDEEDDHHSESEDSYHNSHDRDRSTVSVGSDEGLQQHAKRASFFSEYYEGPEESADYNSFYAPLYRKASGSEETDLPLDIENNDLLWVPPPPEDEDDEIGIGGEDDDDNDVGGVWGSTHSFGSRSSGDNRCREKAATEEQRKAMRAVVDGHFKVLVAQLLQGEGISSDEEEGWLDIVTALSLQAAEVVKPDTSVSGGMDPGGIVKVKCVATGRPSESNVVKGIVCKKNVAHRRMTSCYKNPRLLLLGGALELQEHLSSMKTMLEQGTDHLTTAVARIDAHHPNVLLLEKTVPRQVQEKLLQKDISIVLNVKRPLLERISRCTGASIISDIDHLMLKSTRLGYCECFHVDKYFEEHEKTGQDGKKITKTLMFFEGCPRPLGCTILLKGSNSTMLKKVKRAVQYAVFAAYHLALETSFLVDEGVNVPELRLKSPLSVALPDKKSKSDMSISTVSGFLPPPSQAGVKTQAGLSMSPSLSAQMVDRESLPGVPLSRSGNSSVVSSRATSPLSSPFRGQEANADHVDNTKPWSSVTGFALREMIGATLGKLSQAMTSEDMMGLTASLKKGYLEATSSAKAIQSPIAKIPRCDERALLGESNSLLTSEPLSKSPDGASPSSVKAEDHGEDTQMQKTGLNSSRLEPNLSSVSSNQENEDQEVIPEDFPPSPSDHQSILVSFSSSCLRKGTICERGHLFRIKYYGTFDKPLGRFLRETVFDLTFKCSACGEPKDAHVDCYTHRQGSLTISVHKQNQTLPGEVDGKIWMWHRCLKCARSNGIPPSTHRLVMSDAAWGLSFGKFLELSFSNHAAASRVASCGHSLHRDCLRFYGFGNLVACFRYSPVNVYSVYLPPSKLEFHYSEHQDWLHQEILEITEKGDRVFRSVAERLHQIKEKAVGHSSVKEAENLISLMEDTLLKHKIRFQTALDSAASASHGMDQPHVDILQLNYINQSISLCSSLWDNWLQNLLCFLKPGKTDLKLLRDSLSSLLKEFSFGNERSSIPSKSLDMCVTTDPNSGAAKPAQVVMDGSTSLLDKMKVTSAVGSMKAPLKGSDTAMDRSLTTLANIGAVVVHDSYGEHPSGKIGGLHKVKSVEALSNSENLSQGGGSGHVAHAITSWSASNSWPVERGNTLDSKLQLNESGVHRSLSEGHFSSFGDLSDTFEAAWTGKGQSMGISSVEQDITSQTTDTEAPGEKSGSGHKFSSSEISDEGSSGCNCSSRKILSSQETGTSGLDPQFTSTLTSPARAGEPSDIEGWVGAPYSSFSRPYSESTPLSSPPREDAESRCTSPFVVSQANHAIGPEGHRISLPVGITETVVSVYEDEPTSIIAYAITSQEHQIHLSERLDKHKDKERALSDLFDGGLSHPLKVTDSNSEQGDRDRISSMEGSFSSSNDLSSDDPLLYSKAMHIKVSFTDDRPQEKIKYTVTCYYARQFDGLRKKCCPNGMDFIRSLCRCKKWGAQGGKSNVFFAKTADDRFVIKQVTRTELDSFLMFAPAYFKYISDALITGSPTCLAKILGIYQVMVKHGKGGKEVRMDLMVMENLLYGRHVTRVYDLKGSLRSRYNADVSGKNAVLLDQNLLESIQTNPIFISNKAKRLLERAVWNDTAFLASVDVMDYSLLVGIDEERRELVLGIIDFMRQYTWDKHLETWVKASGILGGPKNTTPTVISPKQYKKRFRKAMSTYFLMVPDQWSPLTVGAGVPNTEAVDNNSLVAAKGGAVEESDTI